MKLSTFAMVALAGVISAAPTPQQGKFLNIADKRSSATTIMDNLLAVFRRDDSQAGAPATKTVDLNGDGIASLFQAGHLAN